MKIMIICTKYPPDTSIGAVRPYMLAKYLAKRGHNITVVRSGELYQKPDSSLKILPGVRVISLHGDESPAEIFEKFGEYIKEEHNDTSKEQYVPLFLRPVVTKIYRFLMAPVYLKQRKQRVSTEMALFKRLIDDELCNERFDVVFSTCGGAELVFEARYASSFFKCKWIQDFRDLLDQPVLNGWYLNRYKIKVQDMAVKEADVVTGISEGICESLIQRGGKGKVVPLYNGYDDTEEDLPGDDSFSTELTFCYTGRIYGPRVEGFVLFIQAMAALINEGKIDRHGVKFVYAGSDSETVSSIMEESGIKPLLEDHGFVTREEAAHLQSIADVFIVFSWNTQREKGILTGKFYEGIRARKNIVTVVVGDCPNSELFLLNQKYNYGYCFEEVSFSTHFCDFKEYLYSVYREKEETNTVAFPGADMLVNDFNYKNIALKLENLMQSVLGAK